MSKRFIFVQQGGERKKPRLDITVSDHNFPLSQNPGPSRAEQDAWGDDIDDEMLLQASQVCEQACSNTSMLPEYSQFMRPGSSSTQIPPNTVPSTSRGFTFKTPSGPRTSVITQLKDTSKRNPSPRSVISSKVETDPIDLTDNYFTDKVFNTGDTDYVYRQLLKLQEENAKLKSENGKLSEKCVTKEGEASILRTQLKTCQKAVGNARLDKVKAQEQLQVEWSTKLAAVSNQVQDLQTQLDFKNLEVLSVKEKCKMLESNRIRMTQVTITGNDFSTSQRINSNAVVVNSFAAPPIQKSTASCSIQTDTHPHFIKLSKPYRIESSRLTQLLPLIMEPSVDQQYSFLDYNENLKRPDTPVKCTIFSTFHRLSLSSSVASKPKNKISLTCIYEDLSCIAASDNNVEKLQDKYLHVFATTRSVLEEVRLQLASAARRCTAAFQRDMDERYLDAAAALAVPPSHDLLAARELYKEEQATLARRMTAVLAHVIDSPPAAQLFTSTQQDRASPGCVDLMGSICALLDDTSCAILYSGLLLSMLSVIEKLIAHSTIDSGKVLDIVKRVTSSRALLFVPCAVLRMLPKMKVQDGLQRALCVSSSAGNLKVDHDQGVLLYKKDSCSLQVLLKQVEVAMKCIERQALRDEAARVTRDLLLFHNVYEAGQGDGQARCECNRVLMQTIVYSLRVCSAMLVNDGCSTGGMSEPQRRALTRACRGGVQATYRGTLRDELPARLGYCEGHLTEFIDNLRQLQHNQFYSTMLSEMVVTLQAVPEERPPPVSRSVWLRSFEHFSLAD